MGRSANVTISNFSKSVVRVTFSNKNCMYDNGEDGSDFGPLTSEVAPGQKLPLAGEQTKLESIASGSCATTPSTYRMEFAGRNDASPVAALNFWQQLDVYKIDNGPTTAGNYSEPSKQSGGTLYTVYGGAFKVTADIYPVPGTNDVYAIVSIYDR